jgi:hypothetical protein
MLLNLQNSGRGKALRSASTAGEPIRFSSCQLVLVTRTTSFCLPLLGSFFVWKRPEAVIILRDDGTQDSLRVGDTTRTIQLSILCAGILGAWLIWRNLRTHA